MRTAILEITTSGCYLKCYRGFIQIMQKDKKLGQVVIDELNSVIISTPQMSLSVPTLSRLAKENIPLVICDSTNYLPTSLTLPLSAHHHSTAVLQNQINASKAFNKRLWQALVIHKIRYQQLVITTTDGQNTAKINRLNKLAQTVQSGDPQNLEAQAAKVYWHQLFNTEFSRNPNHQDFINSALNYGYTIVRAACARALVGAGLNPALGVHHCNRLNAFCLADDVMEIFRPLVDYTVIQFEHRQGQHNLTPQHKRQLARLLEADVIYNEKTTIVSTAMHSLAASLAKAYAEKDYRIQLPQLKLN